MKSNTLLISTIVAILFIFLGCGKMDDSYREFLKGETIYIAKADSMKVRSGNKRIELSWLLLSDPKVIKYKIFWDNRSDSIENNVTKTADVDTIRLIINNIAEGTHEFEIYTYDKYGNSSIKATVIGKVYGSHYASTLLPVFAKSVDRSEKDMVITWPDPGPTLSGIDIRYYDNAHVLKEVHANSKESTSTLKEFPRFGEFEYKTSFLPEPDALDTFYTDYTTIKLRPDTIVNWNNYRGIFGHFSSLILVGDPSVFNQDLYRVVLDESGDFYKEPQLIGNGWGVLENISTRGPYFIAQIPSAGGVTIRYGYDHATGTFPGPNPLISGGEGWADADKLFIFNNDIMVRDRNSGKLIRHYLNSDATEVIRSESIVSNDSWNKYGKLIAVGSWIFGITPDGKLWRVAISNNNVASDPVQIAEGWNGYMLSVNGDDLLCRTSDGVLREYPLDANGELGVPREIWVTREVLGL